MAETTTIKIRVTTKRLLDTYREIPSETYDEILRKLTSITEDLRDEPELSRETLRKLDESRARTSQGRYLTHEELCERLGLNVPAHLRRGRAKATRRTPKVVTATHR